MTTERQMDQQWVENTRALYLDRSNRALAEALPSLRDAADRARVEGGCFLCQDVTDCPTPALCGVEKPSALGYDERDAVV